MENRINFNKMLTTDIDATAIIKRYYGYWSTINVDAYYEWSDINSKAHWDWSKENTDIYNKNK